MFFSELILAGKRISAYTENRNILCLKVFEFITESFSFGCSSGGACFWEKPQQHFLPFEVAQCNHIPF